jgi:hypothetical protein
MAKFDEMCCTFTTRSRKGSQAVRQIYLSPEEAEKARAPTTTDEVISCHFSRHLPNRILVVQRRRGEGGALEFVACVFEYREAEVRSRSHARRLRVSVAHQVLRVGLRENDPSVLDSCVACG